MKLWLTLLFLLLATSAQGATYWVSTTGTGANGCVNSSTLPVGNANFQATIQGAFNCVGTSAGQGAGHTVYVMNGTYNQHLDMNSGASIPSGTVGNFFTFSVAPGQTAVILRSSGSRTGWLWGNLYMTINGFIFDGSLAYDGQWVLGTGSIPAAFITFTNNDFKDTRCFNTILLQGTTHDITFDRNLLHGGEHGQGSTNTYFEHVVPGCSDASTSINAPVGIAYLVYQDTPGSNIVFTHNDFYDFQRIGLHFYGGSGGPQGFTFANNKVHHFGSYNRDPGARFTRGTATDVAGIAIYYYNQTGTVGGKFYNNIIYTGNAGLLLSGTVTNNIVVGNTIYGISPHPNFTDTNKGEGLSAGPSTSNTSVTNNIVANNTVNIINDAGSSTTFTTNLCTTAGGTANCAITGNPLFTDAANGDFHLNTGSAAIDVGTNLGSAYSPDYAGVSRPTSGPWDVGAYEFGVPILPPTPQLVLALPLDEGVSTTAVDVSGQKNNASFAGGVTWDNTGKYGKAVMFDGTGSLNIPASASLSLAPAMTLEAWVYPTIASSTFSTVIFQDRYYLYSASDAGYCPTPASGAGGGYSAATAENYICATAVPPINDWSHLAITHDGLNMTFYLNGKPLASKTSIDLMIAASANVTLGVSAFGEFFTGKIDEVRIYNYARSPTQIVSDMNTPLIGAPGKYVEIASPTSVEISAATTLEIGAD